MAACISKSEHNRRMERRWGEHQDATDATTWTKYKCKPQPAGLTEKPRSGWDQCPDTISHKNSRSTREAAYSPKQSGIANNYFTPYYKRENSSVDNKQRSFQSSDEDTKLLVSNVHLKVTESDILELFGEFKSLKFSRVNHDSSGRPLGSAELVFGKRADAMKAIELYNSAKLDGRVLNIQVATPEILATSPFKNAVTFIPTFRKSKNYSKQYKSRDGQLATKTYNQGKKRRATVEELDAQLDLIVQDRLKSIE